MTPFTAQDIVTILEAAQKTDVLRMKLGEVEFERQGYVPAPQPETPMQQLLSETQASQEWLKANPPANVLGDEPVQG